MIDDSLDSISVRKQCKLLGINRSNVYYQYKKTNDTELANLIHDIWVEMPYYGYRRITYQLKRDGYQVNHKRVARVMRESKIKAIYPKERFNKNNTNHKKYPYLLNGLKIEKPNQVWGSDITYIKLPDGFVYLIGLIDWSSRFIVAWKISNTLDAGFCLDTLKDAFKVSKPEILNTDQGVQFTSIGWIEFVENNGVKVSMDGKGRWADNVIIERFWRTLKYEHVYLHGFNSLLEANKSIGEFIEIYNNKRLHSSLNYRTPSEIYNA